MTNRQREPEVPQDFAAEEFADQAEHDYWKAKLAEVIKDYGLAARKHRACALVAGLLKASSKWVEP